MLLLSVVVIVLRLNLASATNNEKAPAIYSRKDNVHKVFNTYLAPLSKMNSNVTIFEEGENMLVVPNFPGKKNSLLKKNLKKSPRKPPKRITQKIIKKIKSKTKKAYWSQMTSLPTEPSQNIMNNPSNNELAENESPTTQPTMKKKRKWNSKLPRYPMPFQKLQSMKDPNAHKRTPRDVNRSDLYILQDLDEMEFLSHEKDTDIVKAHIKQYW